MPTNIAFVGAGIAASYTLSNFLNNLKKQNASDCIDIFVIDKHHDFFKGIPYGERSSNAVLLINDLKSFIPEPQRADFVQWLNKNYEKLVEKFINAGGHHAKEWVAKYESDYSSGNWNDLFVPRFFFGDYIQQKLDLEIAEAETNGIAKIHRIQNEVSDITKSNSEFILTMINGDTIKADKTVLAVGSLNNKALPVKRNRNASDGNLVYIDDLYKPSIGDNIGKAQNVINSRSEKGLNTNVLILGANASGLESIYRLHDVSDVNKKNCEFFVLSTHGVMPDEKKLNLELNNFDTEHIKALSGQKSLTAIELAEAVNKDLDVAESLDIGAGSTVELVSREFGKLLPKLSKEELVNFACEHGNQIGRRQRCAGEHYLSVIDILKTEKRFGHIKGRFQQLEQNRDGFKLHYTTSSNDESLERDGFHIVLNCLGATNLTKDDKPEFITKIIEKGLVSPNKSKIGLSVNENMEASEGFYVAGPLLAGNFIEDRALWHLEHCGRIIWSSVKLAEKIIA
ncbi:FAD/NAD(P)-binding protein [uncultured Croceitalea sp.]|uniref:FAD/NAD(P)-binding protein n=1 Tax=uncultured Croceitalea sp. TaxID=1798908 RepID=UPI003305E1D7